MKIITKVNQQPFCFRVKLMVGTMTCKVRLLMSDKWKLCVVSDDFSYIIFPENEPEVVLLHSGETKVFEKIEIPHRFRYDFVDYAEIK